MLIVDGWRGGSHQEGVESRPGRHEACGSENQRCRKFFDQGKIDVRRGGVRHPSGRRGAREIAERFSVGARMFGLLRYQRDRCDFSDCEMQKIFRRIANGVWKSAKFCANVQQRIFPNYPMHRETFMRIFSRPASPSSIFSSGLIQIIQDFMLSSQFLGH